MKFTGCGTALVTPFTRTQALDESALRALVRRQIEAGINFLVPCGTTGESPTLTRREHLRVVEITLEEASGVVPVLAGCGGYNTAEVTELGQELAALGADGLLSVTPYYNKPTQEGLYQHYKAIAEGVTLPIVVYSVQGRTGVNVEPATLKRLAAEVVAHEITMAVVTEPILDARLSVEHLLEEDLVGLVYSVTPKDQRTDPKEHTYPWYRRTLPLAGVALAMVIVLNVIF